MANRRAAYAQQQQAAAAQAQQSGYGAAYAQQQQQQQAAGANAAAGQQRQGSQPAAGQPAAGQAASGYGQQGQQPQQGQQQQYQGQQQQQQPQQQQQQQADGDEGVGNERNISVTGCNHATVGSIVRGSFTLNGENHGKPTYKKDTQVNGLDVMLYFWDERDGPNFCGWWFGPKVGGDQVWAYHPSRTAKTAPTTGWKVPYDGPVDTTFVIAKAGAAQPQAAAQGQQGFGGLQLNNFARQQQGGQQAAQAQQEAAQQAQQQYAAALQRQQQAAQQAQQEQLQRMRQQQQQQQHQQQIDAQRRALDENRKKLEEANRKRIEEQRKRVEEMKQQQAEQQRKAEEERLQKEKEMAQKKEEQRAMLAIRRVIQKVRLATPANIEELEKELQEVLAKELEACATQKDRMKQESDTGLEQGKQRIEQIKEQQRKAEEARLEKERKLKEALEAAEALLKDLEGQVEEAEELSKSLKEEAEPFTSGKDLDLEEISATSNAVNEAMQEAKEKLKACTDFISQKGPEMRVQGQPGQASAEIKTKMTKLLQRINESTRGNDTLMHSIVEAKRKAVAKAEAKKKLKAQTAVFDKYDTDKDGMLSQKEVEKYMKGEFQLKLTKVQVEAMMAILVEEGVKGVKKADFHKLKVSIGIARERIIDAERKKAREAKEKRLAELKAELQEKITEAKKTIDALGEKVQATMTKAPLPNKGANMPAGEMLKHADEIDEAVKEAKEAGSEAKTTLTEIAEGVDEDLKVWLGFEIRKLQGSLNSQDPKLTRASNVTSKIRDDARKKESEEIYALEKRALDLIKGHQRVKKLSNEAMFAEIDADKDDKISEAEFVNFFSKCEREPPAKKAKTEDNGDKKEDEEKKEEEKEEEEAAPEVPMPSKEELERLFASIDEEGDGAISKDKFTNLIRTFMKVVKDTVITSGIAIKDSKPLRRLEVGELVEIVEGPTSDEGAAGVSRVHAKVMKDDLDGWITLSGNKGTSFLEDSGNQWKVVKETIMTESFELDGGAAKENARKLKVNTRKLKEGEIVEVREWARKEETSGLMRMKCKAKSDGATGWVTTIGNQGTVFLEIM